MRYSHTQFARRFRQWLFTPPEVPVTPLKVIKWWECRRPAYNFIVGTNLALLMCLMLAGNSLFNTLQSEDEEGSMFALLVFIVLANFCYTLGWVLDAPKKFFDRKHGQGPGDTVLLFRYGLGLSLLLIYGPAIFWVVTRLVQELNIAKP